MSSSQNTTFQKQLEAVYERYRHQSLERRLDAVATTMEETILQRILAETFLETNIDIDDEAKQAVRTALQLVEDDRYDELDEQFDELEATVEEQERHVSNQSQKVRIAMSSSVNGMTRLNERVGRVDAETLEKIQTLLDDWNWKEHVYRDEDESIEVRKRHAERYGDEMREHFDEAREKIFGPYDGTPLQLIVNGLMHEERLSLDDLTEDQIALLRDSDLEEHIELKLS